MGFNNCYLPEYNELIEYFNSVSLEVFVKRYRKYDCWTGSSESMNFLENKIKEYEKVIDNDIGFIGDVLQKGDINSNNKNNSK